jgi:threonine dehydrogenase-like Zn-dependent dehydrogenase
MHGIDRANIRPGDTVVIIGAGSIGQIMIQLARFSGAANVIAVDPIEEKRDRALALGACLAVDPVNEDVKEAVMYKVIYARKNPELYDTFKKRSGGGILSYGLPGTGKTLINEVIAHERNATC